MFAGPNGSGKSVLKTHLSEKLLGVYLNPDELEELIRKTGRLDFSDFGIQVTAGELFSFLECSEQLQKDGSGEMIKNLLFNDNRLDFSTVQVNSYFAATLTDFLRQMFLGFGVSFTFETVMSHESKVELLKKARARGYRTYLYYIATDDPEINISRVENRVKLRGHDVPPERIRSRYARSLELLFSAIRNTDRAYIFDNSTDNQDSDHTWLAEVTDGRRIELKADRVPIWFKRAVLDKIPVLNRETYRPRV